MLTLYKFILNSKKKPPLSPPKKKKPLSAHHNNFEARPDLCLKDKSQIGSVFQVPGELDAQSPYAQQGAGQSYLDNTGGDQGLVASVGLGQQTQTEDNPVISSPPGGAFASWQADDTIQPLAALGGGGGGGVEPSTGIYAQIPTMGGGGDDGMGNQIIPAANNELTNPSWS